MTISAEVACALGEQAQRLERVGDALIEAMDILAEVEWIEVDGVRVCPWCLCEHGHASNCRLGNRLAEWNA